MQMRCPRCKVKLTIKTWCVVCHWSAVYGVFDTADSMHVAPVDNKGIVAPPHTLDELCCCEPEIVIIEGSDRLLVTRNEEN